MFNCFLNAPNGFVVEYYRKDPSLPANFTKLSFPSGNWTGQAIAVAWTIGDPDAQVKWDTTTMTFTFGVSLFFSLGTNQTALNFLGIPSTYNLNGPTVGLKRSLRVADLNGVVAVEIRTNWNLEQLPRSGSLGLIPLGSYGNSAVYDDATGGYRYLVGDFTLDQITISLYDQRGNDLSSLIPSGTDSAKNALSLDLQTWIPDWTLELTLEPIVTNNQPLALFHQHQHYGDQEPSALNPKSIRPRGN